VRRAFQACLKGPRERGSVFIIYIRQLVEQRGLILLTGMCRTGRGPLTLPLDSARCVVVGPPGPEERHPS